LDPHLGESGERTAKEEEEKGWDLGLEGGHIGFGRRCVVFRTSQMRFPRIDKPGAVRIVRLEGWLWWIGMLLGAVWLGS